MTMTRDDAMSVSDALLAVWTAGYHDRDAEIKRLRGLLMEGLEHHDEYDWQQRVREALGND